jgi:dTDP-4-dehydrorhamnose 3,5-epimerase
MKITQSKISDVILLEPEIVQEYRGQSFESFNFRKFSNILERKVSFVQEYQYYLPQAVLRGLHYQVGIAQGKLFSVNQGKIFCVAVDMRRNSKSFGFWTGEVLSEDNMKKLWIPEGFASGFLVLSDRAKIESKLTEYRHPELERCIRYDDKQIAIKWPIVPYEFPIALGPELTDEDKNGTKFSDAELFI